MPALSVSEATLRPGETGKEREREHDTTIFRDQSLARKRRAQSRRMYILYLTYDGMVQICTSSCLRSLSLELPNSIGVSGFECIVFSTYSIYLNVAALSPNTLDCRSISSYWSDIAARRLFVV